MNKLNHPIISTTHKPIHLNHLTQMCVTGGCLQQEIFEENAYYNEIDFFKYWCWQRCCYCPYPGVDDLKIENIFLQTKCELMQQIFGREG